MSRHRVAIYGSSRSAMLDLVRVHKVEVLDHGSRRLRDGRLLAWAVLEQGEVERLRAAGYGVECHEDVERVGRERQREVGVGDRYRERRDG